MYPLKRRAKLEMKRLVLLHRQVLGGERLLPSFLVIGGQRCGTSYLYELLSRHTLICAALLKEIHYFSTNYYRGWGWYTAHFPKMRGGQDSKISPRITGEASPYYMFHPYVPQRVARDVPDAKLIAILRNPVTRAYSHYQMEVGRGREKLSFEEAIEREGERVAPDLRRLTEDENYYGFNHHHFTYLSRGHYAEQLERWLTAFPRDRFLVLKSEDFFAEPGETLQRVFRFLGVPQREFPELTPNQKYPTYPKLTDTTHRKLEDYFALHNERLRQLFGLEWSSNRAPPNRDGTETGTNQ